MSNKKSDKVYYKLFETLSIIFMILTFFTFNLFSLFLTIIFLALYFEFKKKSKGDWNKNDKKMNNVGWYIFLIGFVLIIFYVFYWISSTL